MLRAGRRLAEKGRVRCTKLSNGMRVVTQDTYDAHTSIQLTFNAGLREEAYAGRGSYNMLKALTAAGATKKVGGEAKLHGALASMGGDLTLDFKRETSSLAVSVPKGEAKSGLDLLKDLAFGVDTSDKKIFDETKAKLYQEVESNPPMIKDTVIDRLHSSTFRDYSLGYSLYNNDFEQATPAAVAELAKASRTTDKLVVSAVGSEADHDALVKQCETLFKDAPRGAIATVPEQPYFCGAWMNYQNEEMGPNAFWALGWQSCPMGHNDALAFMLMEEILGEYIAFNPKALVPNKLSHNRLTNAIANLRNSDGSGIYHKAENYWYRDTGMFTVYGVSDELDVMYHLQWLQFHVTLLSHSVTDEELERAKKQFKRKMFSGLGGTDETASKLAEQVIHLDKPLNQAELLERLDNIDSDDIKRVAFNNLNDKEISVMAMGATHGVEYQYIMHTRNVSLRY